jgi:hypothetical protein
MASISEHILFRKLETSDLIVVAPRANVRFLCPTETWAIIHPRHSARAYASNSQRRKLMKTPDIVPIGLLKALVPEDKVKRTEIRLQLEKAGFSGTQSVRNFYFFRLMLAMTVATKLKCPMLRKVEMSHQTQTVARLCSPETLSIGGRRSLAAVMVKVGKEPKPTNYSCIK